MQWVNVEDELPDNFEDVLVKTDCSECPVIMASYIDKFILPAIVQCDHHYETDQKFSWVSALKEEDVEMYRDRIIKWCYINKGKKGEKGSTSS